MNDEILAFISKVATDLAVTQARCAVMNGMLINLVKTAPDDFLERQIEALDNNQTAEFDLGVDALAEAYIKSFRIASDEWRSVITNVLDARK